MIKIENLNVEYMTQRGPLRAVIDAGLEVGRGETLGIVGESGAGKTTLAMALLRILPMNARITSGRVLIEDKEVTAMSEDELNRQVRWSLVSYVPQASQNALDPIYRIGDQFMETVRAHSDMGEKETLERASELLRRVGVDPSKLSSYPWELSGGQKQRIMIAMALILSPRVVILDEPTTALDTLIQAQILELFRELKEFQQLTAVFISHDISVIANVSNRVAIMYAGRVVEVGDAQKIFFRPLHPYTQGLLRSIPDLRSSQPFSYVPGTPPDLMNPPSGCPFHPRCPIAIPVCRQLVPELLSYEADHSVACHVASSKTVKVSGE